MITDAVVVKEVKEDHNVVKKTKEIRGAKETDHDQIQNRMIKGIILIEKEVRLRTVGEKIIEVVKIEIIGMISTIIIIGRIMIMITMVVRRILQS